MQALWLAVLILDGFHLHLVRYSQVSSEQKFRVLLVPGSHPFAAKMTVNPSAISAYHGDHFVLFAGLGIGQKFLAGHPLVSFVSGFHRIGMHSPERLRLRVNFIPFADLPCF
jgi:hypothetical protein